MEIDVRSGTMILMFGQDGCAACEEQVPILRAVAQKHSSVPAFAIDCAKQPEAANAFQVEATPTTLLVHNGKQIIRLVGTQDEGLLERLFLKAEQLLSG